MASLLSEYYRKKEMPSSLDLALCTGCDLTVLLFNRHGIYFLKLFLLFKEQYIATNKTWF